MKKKKLKKIEKKNLPHLPVQVTFSQAYDGKHLGLKSLLDGRNVAADLC